MNYALDLQSIRAKLNKTSFCRQYGHVVEISSGQIKVVGLSVFLGEVCHVWLDSGSIDAEVVVIKADYFVLMPYGVLSGVTIGTLVERTGQLLGVKVGNGLKGHVINALGEPFDTEAVLKGLQDYPLRSNPINPLSRNKIDCIFHTGVKAIDAFLTLGVGQRIGIFAGSGVGKSTLLNMIATNSEASVNVIALIGERGREAKEFLERCLQDQSMSRSVIVVSTSDDPPLMRIRAAFVATAIAEFFRGQGEQVCLIMDSITRLAMAQREIGLTLGEQPTVKGYTPSVFAIIPYLLERCGGLEGEGSITAVYTVLAEGDDLNDPVADFVRSILDGHIALSRDLAHQGQYPAVDVLSSVSRLMSGLISDHDKTLVKKSLKIVNEYTKNRDMLELGLYKPGQNPQLDEAVKLKPKIYELLRQPIEEKAARSSVLSALGSILRG